MKRIILFRHGKSDWEVGSGNDHDRPLQGRGKRAARLMGRFLGTTGLLPVHVISSTAKRALRTAEIANAGGQWDAEIELSASLYGASPATLASVLRRVSNEVETVVAVGHEPTWSGAVEYLTGARVRMPTAAMACIELGVGSWADVGPGSGELEWFVTPKSIAALAGDPDD